MKEAGQENIDKESNRRRLRAGCALLFLFALVAVLGFGAGVYLRRTTSNGEVSARPDAPAAPEAEREPQAPATSEGRPPDPADEPPLLSLPGRIVFVNPSGQVGTVAPNGEEARVIARDDDLYLFPAWSPDGDHLAAIGSSSNGAGLFAFTDSDDSQITDLYFSEVEAPIYFYWAPDGAQISFIAQHGGELGLFLAPSDGGNDSRLLATGQPFYWQWAGNGEELLIHTGSASSNARLAFLGLDANLEDNLGSPGFFQAPGISADGSFLAFAELDDERERWLVIQDEDQGEVHRLPHAGAVAMGWSPTRSQLAFTSPEVVGSLVPFHYYGPLRLFDVDDEQLYTLVDDTVIAFFWAPDGRSIAYLTAAEQEEELNASLSGPSTAGRRSRRAQQEREPLQMRLWVVDVDSSQIRLLLTFEPTDLFVRQFLPFFDQYALSHRLWSPDGRALVIPVTEGERERVYVVPLDGGALRAVAEGNIAFWSPR